MDQEFSPETSTENPTSKKIDIRIVILDIIGTLIIIGGIWYYFQYKNKPVDQPVPQPSPPATTEETPIR